MDIDFELFKELVLYHSIKEWNYNEIVLDNGIKISIEETDADCCAGACGDFTDVKLDAVITDVSEPKYESWDDGDTYGCYACVKFMHNQNLICQANANADAGNGGYYYSIASFIVKIPSDSENYICEFVSSDY